MLQVFIDANIYLRFFAYSEDDIEELEKFKALIKTKQVVLIATDQVVSEVQRNKEAELARALDRFQKSGSPFEIPRFALHLDSAKELNQAYKTCLSFKKDIIEQIRADLEASKLGADHLILEMFSLSHMLRTSSDHISRAERRRIIGNPPGKQDSTGDQINWELLLESASRNDPLHIISNDRDFESSLFPGKAAFPLSVEWRITTGQDLYLYRSLGTFAKEHFPDIRISSDVIKATAIIRLIKSASYSETHGAIDALDPVLDEITYEDAVAIFTAMSSNPAVFAVAHDFDVRLFFEDLYRMYQDRLPREVEEKLWGFAPYLADIAKLKLDYDSY